MKLSEEGKQALEVVRAKIIKGELMFSSVEADCIGVVFKELSATQGVKVSAIIDRSCQPCIVSAIKIVKNYINFHESNEIERKAVVIEVSGVVFGDTLEEVQDKSESKKETQEEYFKDVIELHELSELKQKELIDLCKNRGIKYPRNPKKDELIKLLNENK